MTIFRSSVALPVLLAAASAAFAPRLAFAGDPAGGAAAPPAASQETEPASAAPAPIIDEAAMALLLKSQKTMTRLKTYSAEHRMILKNIGGSDAKPLPSSAFVATMTFARPNLMHLEFNGLTADASGNLKKKSDAAAVTQVSDGRNIWMLLGKTYRKTPLTSPDQLAVFGNSWVGFFTTQSSPYGQVEAAKKKGLLIEVHSQGTESFAGVACQKILVRQKFSDGSSQGEVQTTWYIGPDSLVRRQLTAFSSKQLNYTMDETLSNIKADAPVANRSALFSYTPSAGIKPYIAPPPRQQPVLLANGVAAPDFTAVDSTGATVKLSDFRGKVVVVDFWASWCPPCKASMPHNQEVTKKLQDANVPMVLLAVDNSEDQPAFAKWVKEHPDLGSLRFVYCDPAIRSVSNDDYHVSGIPTQYVIDPSGIIRASFVGYDSPNDDLENAVKAALLKTASK